MLESRERRSANRTRGEPSTWKLRTRLYEVGRKTRAAVHTHQVNTCQRGRRWAKNKEEEREDAAVSSGSIGTWRSSSLSLRNFWRGANVS